MPRLPSKIYGDEDSMVAREQSSAFKSIRQENTDVYNRLHSIAEDAAFVSSIVQLYPNFRIYPNLRCGAWYADPQIAQTEPVYFKSTDGHFGQWGFNLRRPNIHLLSAVSECNGIILVDSTRRGKRLPDALSKTIPIWCAVINLAIAKGSPESSPFNDHPLLYTPPGAVSRSEHTQIESRLDVWATNLLSSEFSIPPLQKPLRPIWITPSISTTLPLDAMDFFPIVCVSASKLVPDGIERRSAGFTYVQGSGDDHESWSQGLTPQLYWRNQAQLLTSTRSDLSNLISQLVLRSPEEQRADAARPVFVAHIKGRLAIGAIPPIASEINPDSMSYAIIASRSLTFPLPPSPNVLLQESAAGKKGQYSLLNEILPHSLDFIRHQLGLGKDVTVLCEDGKDISVGVAVAALYLYFDDKGNCIVGTATAETPTKQAIHKRLQWILADNNRANPSRTTLKRVNEFLMSPPRARQITK